MPVTDFFGNIRVTAFKLLGDCRALEDIYFAGTLTTEHIIAIKSDALEVNEMCDGILNRVQASTKKAEGGENR